MTETFPTSLRKAALRCAALLVFLAHCLTACEEETEGSSQPGDRFEPYNLLVSQFDRVVYIRLMGDHIEVSGPAASEIEHSLTSGDLSESGIVHSDSVSSATSHISIRSEAEGIAYFLYGGIVPKINLKTGIETHYYGKVSIESLHDYALYLNGARLHSYEGPALESKSDATCYLVLCNGSKNFLYDSRNYVSATATPACFYSNGDIILDGTGSLTISSQGEISAAEGLYAHALQAQSLTCGYDIRFTLSAAGDAIHASSADITIKKGVWDITAGGNGLSSMNGEIYLDGGTLFGTAARGSFIYTPMGDGLMVDSAVCFAASSLPSDISTQDGQRIWQQVCDTITLKNDTLITAYGKSGKLASFTPHLSLSSPWILLSTSAVQVNDSITFR